MHEWYDMDGNFYVTDVLEWARWMEALGKERFLKQEYIGRYFVSTVFLGGLDHNYGEGPPLLFETMVFLNDGKFHDEMMDRYSTREEALLGHERHAELLRLTERLQPAEEEECPTSLERSSSSEQGGEPGPSTG